MRQKRLIMLGILAAGVFVLLAGSRDITSSHEGRVAQTARVMADSGPPWSARPVEVPSVTLRDQKGVIKLAPGADSQTIKVNPWLIPVLDGRIRLQKPPLPYWCDAALFRLMGPSALSARLIPALLGAIATFVLFDLARMLFGAPVAWFTALLWLSSYFVPEEYRKTMADPYLAFFTLACAWAWVKAALTPIKPGRKSAGIGLLLLFYLFAALGLLGKGPPLIAHLVIVIGAFHLCFRKRAPGRWWGHAVGVAIVLLIALPWAAYVYSHIPHVVEMWRYESIGELSDNTKNERAWWFYLPQLWLIALPWIGLWILGIISPFTGSRAARRRRRPRPFFPLIWYAATVIFFSFVNLKKNAYLLPAMPAQTLLMAQGAIFLAAWLKRKPDEWLPGVIVLAQAITGIGFALWLGWVMLIGPLRQPPVMGGLLFIIALAAGAYPLWRSWRITRRTARAGARSGIWSGGYAHWLAAQAVGYAVLLSLFFNFYSAPKENRGSPRPFIAAMAPMLQSPGATVARVKMDPTAAFYLPADLPPFDPSASTVYVIVENSKRHPAGDDFSYLGLTKPIGEITSIRAPRSRRWMLVALRTKPGA